MDVNKIQEQLVTKLRFQILVFILLGIIYARGSWNVFGVLFLAGEDGHTCNPTHELVKVDSRSNELTSNKTAPNYTVVTGTWEGADGSSMETVVVKARECDIIVAGKNGSNVSVPCKNEWIYGSQFESTIVSEWNLVCVRAYLTELSTTLYMVGSMFGAMLISPLSDRFGRRLILLICLLIQAVIGASVALSPNYAVFTTLRFIVGFFNMGIALCTYVMMTETFPAHQRSIPCCGFQIFWAAGLMMTALFGYIVRDWRHLQLLFSLPNIACAAFVWFLPESLPWLIAKNKLAKAQSVIERIAKCNSIDPPNDLFVYETSAVPRSTSEDACSGEDTCRDQPLLSGTLTHQEAVQLLSEGSTEEDAGEKSENGETSINRNGLSTDGVHNSDSPVHVSQTMIDGDRETQIRERSSAGRQEVAVESCQSRRPEPVKLRHVFMLFTSARMRNYTVILFFLFFVNSLSYFGISLSTPIMHGNQFFNLFLLGAVEIPAYIICIYVCERIGRKVPLCVFLLMCGVMNIAAMLISTEASSGMSGIRIGFVMLGKFAITGAYSVVYLYAAEVFPTSVRNHAIGVASFFENMGSIVAPFIVYFAKSLPELPMVLFGVISIIGGLLVLAMPETHRRPLPQTVEEVEMWGMCRRRSRS